MNRIRLKLKYIWESVLSCYAVFLCHVPASPSPPQYLLAKNRQKQVLEINEVSVFPFLGEA